MEGQRTCANAVARTCAKGHIGPPMAHASQCGPRRAPPLLTLHVPPPLRLEGQGAIPGGAAPVHYVRTDQHRRACVAHFSLGR